MTIQEAINSGLPFRRKTWPDSLGCLIVDEFHTFSWKDRKEHGVHKSCEITPKDVLAEDWEVQQ